MNRSSILTLALLVAMVGVSRAQEHAPAATPYAGLERRTIKALSAEQIADLRAGRGMALALVAELNGYPGPAHVLELSRQLELTDAQRARVEALFAAMKLEAIPIGERLIAEEAALDQQFATHSITPASLPTNVDAIATTQAALRAAHLKYHLSMLEVLTPAQIRRYAELRGYASPDAAPRGHGRHQ
jgi:Spy/CpxP family protein refolding chaperone